MSGACFSREPFPPGWGAFRLGESCNARADVQSWPNLCWAACRVVSRAEPASAWVASQEAVAGVVAGTEGLAVSRQTMVATEERSTATAVALEATNLASQTHNSDATSSTSTTSTTRAKVLAQHQHGGENPQPRTRGKNPRRRSLSRKHQSPLSTCSLLTTSLRPCRLQQESSPLLLQATTSATTMISTTSSLQLQ